MNLIENVQISFFENPQNIEVARYKMLLIFLGLKKETFYILDHKIASAFYLGLEICKNDYSYFFDYYYLRTSDLKE